MAKKKKSSLKKVSDKKILPERLPFSFPFFNLTKRCKKASFDNKKPLIIALISLGAILILLLLVIFGKKMFVGEAIYIVNKNLIGSGEAGIPLVDKSVEVSAGEDNVELPIYADFGTKKSYLFELTININENDYNAFFDSFEVIPNREGVTLLEKSERTIFGFDGGLDFGGGSSSSENKFELKYSFVVLPTETCTTANTCLQLALTNKISPVKLKFNVKDTSLVEGLEIDLIEFKIYEEDNSVKTLSFPNTINPVLVSISSGPEENCATVADEDGQNDGGSCTDTDCAGVTETIFGTDRAGNPTLQIFTCCQNDDDCGAGNVCDADNTCTSAPTDCAEGYVMENGLCVVPELTEDCDAVGDEDNDGFADCADSDCTTANNYNCCQDNGDCGTDEVCGSLGEFTNVCYRNYPLCPENTGDWLIGGSYTLSEDVECSSILILPDGNLRINSKDAENNLVTITTNSLSVFPGGKISADGYGYSGGSSGSNGVGPGAGSAGSNIFQAGGGAGHGGSGSSGGRGGENLGGGSGGIVYGNSLNPTLLGSGGAGGYQRNGGAGGGAVHLIINDNLRLDGIVSANGNDAPGPYDTIMGGGGSGGSIYIDTKNLGGTGKFMADGGAGGIVNPTVYYLASGGGGAGGRIAVYYTNIDDNFDKSLSTVTGGRAGRDADPGEKGTLIFIDKTNKDAFIKDSFRFDEEIVESDTFYSGGTFKFNNLEVSDAKLYTDTSTTLSLDNDLSLNNVIWSGEDGTITNIEAGRTIIFTNSEFIGESLNVQSERTELTNSEIKSNINLNVNNLVIDSNSKISADGYGYSGGSSGLNGLGPGAGSAGSNDFQAGGGAGHGGSGGKGGNDLGGGSGGSVYGNSLNPTLLGSGGAGGYLRNGGAGGGAVHLIINDNLRLDGIVSANGNDAPGPYDTIMGGGGSGGSIFVDVKNLGGTGKLMADGGAVGIASGNVIANGGGGAGGRIAVHYTDIDNAFDKSLSTVTGGRAGRGAEPGEVGTIIFMPISCLNTQPDVNNNGIKDVCEREDSDGDGIPDSIEIGDDPNNPLDTDGDGTADYLDLDSDNDGIPDIVEVGSDPNNPLDTDGDGTADYLDLDSDNDGITDIVEAGGSHLDNDGDGMIDIFVDTDGDGLADAVDPDNGGTPLEVPDTDGDGIPNYLDSDDEEVSEDSDNDNIPDDIDDCDDQEGNVFYPIEYAPDEMKEQINGNVYTVDNEEFNFKGCLKGNIVFDRDNVVDFFDIADFVTYYQQYLDQEGAKSADINQDGTVDFYDVAPFVTEYQLNE